MIASIIGYVVYFIEHPHDYNRSDYTEMYLSSGTAIARSFSQVTTILSDLVKVTTLYPQLQSLPIRVREW